jgi:predicted Zn-dependent protease
MNTCGWRLKTPLVRLCGAGLAIAVSLTTPSRAQPVGIPSMGSASSAELSPALERTLGDALMEQGRRDPTYISDPDVGQYLTRLGRKLAAYAPGGVRHIAVFGVRDPRINAFAIPGGYIGVNSGLVVSAQNESELASVLAHEIGHVAQRHIARGMTQQSQNGGIMMASLAAALLAALAGSGDLAMGVAAFGQAAAVDRQLGFSRQAEQEADRAGCELLR